MHQDTGRPTDAATRAAVLAARCSILFDRIADQGGPTPADHAAEARRLLARGTRRRSRRHEAERALVAAQTGRIGALAPGTLDVLVRDLAAIEYVLRQVARVGSHASATVGV